MFTASIRVSAHSIWNGLRTRCMDHAEILGFDSFLPLVSRPPPKKWPPARHTAHLTPSFNVKTGKNAQNLNFYNRRRTPKRSGIEMESGIGVG